MAVRVNMAADAPIINVEEAKNGVPSKKAKTPPAKKAMTVLDEPTSFSKVFPKT
jgi:hypothetical protein